MTGKVYVVPRGESWAVRREGERNDLSTHLNRNEAVAAGKYVSDRTNCELVVHEVERRSQPRTQTVE